MADEHLQHLMQLIETKQVYTSYALLKKIPADTYIPGKQKIHDDLKSQLIKGKAIHAILQNNRNNGDYPTALKQGLKLQKIVPDYPNLKHDIAAIQATLKKLNALINKAKIAASHGRKQEVIELLQTVRQIDTNHPEIELIEKIGRRKATGNSAKAIIISTLIIVLPCLLFGAEKIMVWQAETHMQDASQQVRSGKFTEASQSIAKMKQNLRFIYVFNTVAKNALLTQANALQTSEVFIEGIRGRVIHDGKFISERKKKIITQFEGLLQKADSLTDASQWQEAANAYNETLDFIAQHQNEVGSEHATVLEKIADIAGKKEEQNRQQRQDECLAIITVANEAYNQQNWPLAIQKFEEAFDFAEVNNLKDFCIDEQNYSLYKSSWVTNLLHKGDTLKEANKPAEAVDYYLQAMTYATAQKMDEVTTQDIQTRIDGLKEQVFITRVRRLILEGDQLIQEHDFKGGLSKYDFSLIMLTGNNEPIPGKHKLTESLIQKIQKAEGMARLTSHTAHLESVAETDLRKYFDLPPQVKLSTIQITPVKHKDGYFVYRISTKSIRDKMQYELLYQINEATGKWSMLQ